MRIGERGWHGVTYPLVGQDVAADLALAPLDELDVSLHAFRGKRLREEVADVRVGVQAGELSPMSATLNSTSSNQPLTVMNCQLKPSLPRSHTNAFMSCAFRPAASQLKDGLRLYASHC